MNPDDEYVDIEGYEGLYKLSKSGIVWSIVNDEPVKPHILKIGKGYPRVSVYKDRTWTPLSVHRLLAIHFIENPDGHTEVDHIDRNPRNNHLSNLRWANRKMQNNNRCNNLANLTEEQHKERLERIKRKDRERQKRYYHKKTFSIPII